MFFSAAPETENYIIDKQAEAIAIVKDKLSSLSEDENNFILKIEFGTYTTKDETIPNCLMFHIQLGPTIKSKIHSELLGQDVAARQFKAVCYYAASIYPTEEKFRKSFNADIAFIWLYSNKIASYAWPMLSVSYAKDELTYEYSRGKTQALKLSVYYDANTGVLKLNDLILQLNQIKRTNHIMVRGVEAIQLTEKFAEIECPLSINSTNFVASKPMEF